MKRPSRILAVVLVLFLSAGSMAILLLRRFGSVGDCNTNDDCPSGKVCLTARDQAQTFMSWIRPERSCLILCTKNSDCPPGEACSFFDGGFGPGAYCAPRPPSPGQTRP